MIPQVGSLAPVGPVQNQTAEAGEGRLARHELSGPGSSSRPETARAIEPPLPPGIASKPDTPERRNLNPPDPNAPAGPPPAFEASILDRAREEAVNPPAPDPFEAAPPQGAVEAAEGALDVEVSPDFDAAAVADAGENEDTVRPQPRADSTEQTERPAEDQRASYDVPPSAEARAEREVATIRRIEVPYDTATVDVSR